MIKPSCLQLIRDVSIVDVVQSFADVKLKQKGTSYSACCPFHNEKSPSFSVSPAKGRFKCFGCGKGGDAIGFVMAKENWGLVEAAEYIGKLAGIEIEYDGSYDKEAALAYQKEQKSMRELVHEAHNTYTQMLHSDKGTAAMQYLLEKRGLYKDTIIEHKLGYAPMNFRTLCDKYGPAGLLPDGEKAGLVKPNKDSQFNDVYIDRIIFPITNDRGELISFGGGALNWKKGDKYPKYINGYQTELYDKSKALYGLYEAIPHIKKLGFAILVEGYFDVIRMHMAGAQNTVATCGTAFTREQAVVLKKYTDTILVVPDTDDAGLAACSKTIEKLTEFGMKCEVYMIPHEDGEKKDPDDFAGAYLAKVEVTG